MATDDHSNQPQPGSAAVTFLGHGTYPAELGESILDVALRNAIDLDHACGAVCACSTCHIKIDAGAENLSEATDDEEDQLDSARGIAINSRLGCQAKITRQSSTPIRVSIPTWNVNLTQEG